MYVAGIIPCRHGVGRLCGVPGVWRAKKETVCHSTIVYGVPFRLNQVCTKRRANPFLKPHIGQLANKMPFIDQDLFSRD
ncbi:hypothetical protein Metfor_0828 [Methanoregula formicica SMSP]|uniref:Uncharacterized protein n=1 Tax=Methanoregula formicica (strain DSM 22288 / NBRC 105244 / SMSP) TaxID=593750 RepID=L0HDL4_METFS|nr:hypothetical protein Metfor_0828 [Methanoregula formicica SMSP]